MGQARVDSFIEAVINTVVGFVINMGANWIILPLFFHTPITFWHNFEMGVIFTIISVVRSYVLRRFFNTHRLFGPRFLE